jgi:hypothetical protein
MDNLNIKKIALSALLVGLACTQSSSIGRLSTSTSQPTRPPVAKSTSNPTSTSTSRNTRPARPARPPVAQSNSKPTLDPNNFVKGSKNYVDGDENYVNGHYNKLLGS